MDGQVQKVAYKYLLNLVQMPYIGILFLAGVVLTLWGIGRNMFFQIKPEKGIWFAGFGVVIVVATLLMSLGFNGTAIYPSKFDLQSSLTIFNSSSSKYTYCDVCSFCSCTSCHCVYLVHLEINE